MTIRDTTPAEIAAALNRASASFESFRTKPPEQIAALLDEIAEQIVLLGDQLIERAQAETALPTARLQGERGRTTNQLKLFAALLREGSWVEATIDHALPDRRPLPKPDIRRMLVPIGPVVVFSASNFPLAFSVAGGDTASAFAAGNPVVVKAHPGHPETSALVARAIEAAIAKIGMPDGIFSMVRGVSHEVGLCLVRHPAAKAVAFTGSLLGGRALFDAATARPEPIPVYAEMGSTNPVFLLPGAVKKNPDSIADGLLQSVTLGVGQFCTNPGLVFGMQDENWQKFTERAAQAAAKSVPGRMLYGGLCERFQQGAERFRKLPGVQLAAQSSDLPKSGEVKTLVFTTDAKVFHAQPALHEELFGPATVLVSCSSTEELERAAAELPGQLTATIHGTEDDLAVHRKLVSILEQKAGRLIFNGFPTGVEVCPSMHHGGPYPATTHSHFTSVGTAAIKRFTRPVCFQNFPDAALPTELRESNPRKIWRLVDNELRK